MLTAWPSKSGDELAFVFDRKRERRIIVSPAWLAESNKLRRFTVEVMRRLDGAGFDCFLPDLPGQNESQVPFASQSITGWAENLAAATEHFVATHCLTIRAGSNIAPQLPGWDYAPLSAERQLKSMLRARILADREAGRQSSTAELLAIGQSSGLDLSGYQVGATMIVQMASLLPIKTSMRREIAQSQLPGAGLWLRAEPDHSPDQADALAAIIAMELTA